MAKLPGSFNAEDHDKMGDFSPVPAGDYVAQIVKSELVETKRKDGKFLKLDFTIIEGEYAGRNVWARLNIINPNPTAVEIAQKELATICQAVGKVRISDSDELHMKPMTIKVSVRPGDGQYLDSNEIKNYSPAEGYAAPKPPKPTGEAAASGKKKAAPWD